MRAYLNGKLSPSERIRIEKILQDNPDLQQEWSLLRAEIASAELLIESETRQLFQQWQQETPAHVSVFREGPRRWAVGIAIALLLGFATWKISLQPVDTPQSSPVLQQQPTLPAPVPPPPVAVAPIRPSVSVPSPTHSKNYGVLASQLLSDPLSGTLRRSAIADRTASTFQQAQEAYAAGNYQRSLDLLKETNMAQQQSAAFLSAHALFQLHRYPEAAIQFQQLIHQNSRQFRFRSEWGLLMCRLADRPSSEQAFNTQLNEILAREEHPYFQQATALKETLDK